jgi:YggT family protein
MQMNFLIFAVNQFFNLLTTILFIYIILSWFARDPYSRLYRFYSALGMVAEPILTPFRRLMGRFSGASMGIDFSPILAFFALQLIQRALVGLLIQVMY